MNAFNVRIMVKNVLNKKGLNVVKERIGTKVGHLIFKIIAYEIIFR